jgi:hypothetical protein
MHQSMNICRARDRPLEFGLEPGIFSKRASSHRADCVPCFCTHRPSLFPIEWFSEVFGWHFSESQKSNKLGHLEEIKVVTRYSYVNLRVDH